MMLTNKETPGTSCLVTTTVLNTEITVENKIPSTSNVVATTGLNTKIIENESKIPEHDKYITTSEFNKVMTEIFAARLKQASLVKTDFDNKLTIFNKRITSNKTKHLQVQKKLNSLITRGYNFFFGKKYFTSNDGSQNTSVYQPNLDTLELKKRQWH